MGLKPIMKPSGPEEDFVVLFCLVAIVLVEPGPRIGLSRKCVLVRAIRGAAAFWPDTKESPGAFDGLRLTLGLPAAVI